MLDKIIARYEALGFDAPTHAWVDNVKTFAARQAELVPSLCDRSNVKEDIAHVMMRYSRALASGHPLVGDFSRDPSRAIFTMDEGDLRELAAVKGVGVDELKKVGGLPLSV